MKIWLLGLMALMLAVPYVTAADEQFANSLLELINQHRATNGIGPLTIDPIMSQAAQEHSEWMNRTGQFAHNCPGETIFDVRAAAWGGTAAENIGQATISTATETRCWGSQCTTTITITVDGSPQDFFGGWKNSLGHNTNMLNPVYTRIGIGLAGINATTDFAA
ncbi:MAG TPA: CAP domain-containing protein [Candidatus Paceibacterota bacterium]|nr:CAP domain-containing protein [Candidatus Pacearchaeota archaeon]HRZ50730.1 CAP domain-containing protein [Candidatus Paceibacterota bacterium]HSA36373.1 CAP domain-containing protein [Candidatus Paceibacterota bacterium]